MFIGICGGYYGCESYDEWIDNLTYSGGVV